MLSVEAVFNVAAVVNAIDDPVGVVLHCCSKNDDFIVF
jgi:hypothetical protein